MTWREAWRVAYHFIVLPGNGRRPRIGWRTAVVAVATWIVIIGIGYIIGLALFRAIF